MPTKRSEFPLLSRQDERRLIGDVQLGRPGALKDLIEANLRFVERIARRYHSYGLTVEDLINEGTLGLIEAAYRFDCSRDILFITYAGWWIRKSMLRALSEQAHLVKLPWHQTKRVKEARDAEKHLHRSLGRPPSREELSEHLSISPDRLDRILLLEAREISLDQPVTEDGDVSLGDRLVDNREDTTERQVLQQDGLERMFRAFPRLNAEQRTAIALRYGLGGRAPMTLSEVGRRMRLSRERVRQIEIEARGQMRQLILTRRPARARRTYPARHRRLDKEV